jgi:hypothetical protein
MGSSERSKVTQQQEEPAIVSVTIALFGGTAHLSRYDVGPRFALQAAVEGCRETVNEKSVARAISSSLASASSAAASLPICRVSPSAAA